MADALKAAAPMRLHRKPAVDWSNPYLRCALVAFPAAHKMALADITGRFPQWVAKARKMEKADREEKERPLAAVLDIDETVLSNLHLGVFLAPPGAQGAAAVEFHAADCFGWPRNSRLNPILPGAARMVAELQRLGLMIFFISGRREAIRAETIENFELVGLAGAAGSPFAAADLRKTDGPLRMRADDDREASVRPYKEAQRREIEENWRIAINVGDQPSDLGLNSDAATLTGTNCFYWIE